MAEEHVIKSFEEELVSVEKASDEADRIKKLLSSRLETVVETMDLSPEALLSKSATEGKVMLLKALLDVAESREKAAINRANVKARSKELDNNEKFGERALELLRVIPIRGDNAALVPPISPDHSDVPIIDLTPEERSSITEQSMRESNTDLTD